jgi:RNA polymerase sigma-70 factor, ECF subfamily
VERASKTYMTFENEEVVQQDNEKVIDELMHNYSKKVYLLAYSYVKDQGLAEDIAQEVFIKCYKHLDKFRGNSDIKTWLYRITVNTAKDFVKSKSFNILKFPKSFFENMFNTESTEEIYIEQDRNEALLQTVLAIPAKYREIIILHYFHGEKTEEIAETLNLNINTVKTRLSRAREILKGKLKKGDEFYGKRS